MCKDNIVSLNQIDHPGEMTFFLSFFFFFHQERGVKKKKTGAQVEFKGREGGRDEERSLALRFFIMTGEEMREEKMRA